MLRQAPSITFKVLGIGALALVMLIPLFQVQSLVRERSGLRDEAIAQIAARWGAAQIIGGPVLNVPQVVRWKTDQGWTERTDANIVLPGKLDVVAVLATEERAYGIYATPVYTATVTLDARFEADDLHVLNQGGTDLQLEKAELRLPLTDVRGLRQVESVRINDVEQRLQPGASVAGMRTIALALPLTRSQLQSPISIHVKMAIAGTERLQFLPLARTTTLDVNAPWQHPSFVGGFLPATHKVGAQGFSAQWQVLELNRGYGQHWLESEFGQQNLGESAFGVTLYQPAGVYQQNERAGKYGVLFIALSFVAFFLFEVLKSLRVHPVQYLLIGVALCTFYLLLLALSEQIGFAAAYAIAAAAVALMIGGYAAAVLATRRAGAILGGSLALVYGLLYGLVVSEQYSLLIGAFALLAVVALMMFLTRKVDWYGESRAPASVDGTAFAAAPAYPQ